MVAGVLFCPCIFIVAWLGFGGGGGGFVVAVVFCRLFVDESYFSARHIMNNCATTVTKTHSKGSTGSK